LASKRSAKDINPVPPFSIFRRDDSLAIECDLDATWSVVKNIGKFHHHRIITSLHHCIIASSHHCIIASLHHIITSHHCIISSYHHIITSLHSHLSHLLFHRIFAISFYHLDERCDLFFLFFILILILFYFISRENPPLSPSPSLLSLHSLTLIVSFSFLVLCCTTLLPVLSRS
jgi:hypothetical protein